MKCQLCHGETKEKNISYNQWYKGRLVVVENVPAEVCQRCGEEYFTPEITDKIQRLIYSGAAVKTMQVPIFDLSAA